LKTKIIIASLVLMLLAVTAYAENTPKIVTDGMEAFKTSGFEAAFDVWLKNSPMDNDKTTISSLKGALVQIEGLYGKMIGYEILINYKLSSTTVRTYAEIHYEKGPVFLFFDSYKTATGWVIPMMRFHTDANQIFPEAFLFKK